MKKNTAAKFLSTLLTALMLLSAFAVIPVGAEEPESAAPDSDVLWSLDFDDYSALGLGLLDYLKVKGINGNGDFTWGYVTAKGKLYLHHKGNGGQPKHDAKTEDTFRDLFYGLYKIDGSYLTDYYMDIDYTLISSEETQSYTFTGTDTTSGNTVTYEIYTPYRGVSYFNPIADSSGAGYGQFLFKVSPTGYLYTPYETGNLTDYSYGDKTFTTANSDNIKYFTYSRKVGTTYTAEKQTVTEEVWEKMVAEAGSGVSYNFTNVHDITKSNGYQLELNKEYTIRVKFSVDSTQTVIATTCVRPVGSDEPFVEVGQAKYKCSTTGKGNMTGAIRFCESKQDSYLDNMKFATFGACADEHESLAVSSSKNENGFVSSELVKCLACGAEWYNYSEWTAVQSFDFTSMDSTEYTKFQNDWRDAFSYDLNLTDEGLAFTVANWDLTANGTKAGPDLTLRTPIKDKDKDYRVSFTAKINTIPVDKDSTTPGSSFFTDRVGGNGYNILLQMGRNADYSDTNKTGWLKMRNSSGGTSWGDYASLCTIEEGKTYTFSLVLRPSVGEYDVYVYDENNECVGKGTGGLNSWDGTSTRKFRIGNKMILNMLLKNYSIEEISEQTYNLVNGSDFDFTFDKGTLSFVNDEKHGALASNVIPSGTPTNSTTLYLNDNDFVLGSTPYTLSFDFMMSGNGSYKDDQSTDSSLWSLVSWLSSAIAGSTTYGTMVRIGGIDNDTDKAGFERFFVVMNNNGEATVTEDNGNQSYTTAVGGETVGYYSDHNAVYTFKAGEWVTFTIAVNPINGSAYLYANGELVGVAAKSAFGKTAGTVLSRLRIGDYYRKFEYNWAIKDISIELTPDTPVEVKDSGTVFNMDFGKGYKVDNETTYNLGSTSYNGVTVQNTFKDSGTAEGYVNFTTASLYKNLFNVSLTSKIGEGEYYNHVEGAKYSIETKFAIKKSGEYTTVLRLSKYHDNNAASLIQRIPSGLQAIIKGGTAIDLYTVDARGNYVRPTAQYEDKDLVDGRVPESNFVKLVVVIDESDDTYSVYINDRVAFYKEGDSYKRAIDLKMNVTTGANSLTTKYPNATESQNWSGLYKDIPREVNDPDAGEQNYGTSGLSTVSYVRFFQNAEDFCVQNIKITKIEDGLNYIGSQIRTESETPNAFDVRFVFGTDNIYVDGIEYDVSVDIGGESQGTGKTAVSETVYRSIYSSVGDVKSWKIGEGDYFSAFSVDGVELGTESTEYTFRITPYLMQYNPESGTVRNATVTHIIKLNGLGTVLSYDTEEVEYANIPSTYTPIADVLYKPLGRTQYLDDVKALTADWSAAGIEFTAECVGEVSVNITTNGTRLFTVVVDDVEYKDVALKDGPNVIATKLPYGEHTFKIMNQGGYSDTVNINGVALRGAFGEPPADSDLFIEFIGDSITHGYGLGDRVGEKGGKYTLATNDGTQTYAFIAAELLGADYTIMANGGMGVMWGGDYDGANVNHSMAKYPYLNDANRKDENGDLIPYAGYEDRKADIVVIGLSTNDNYRFLLQYNDEQMAFKAANTSATDEEVAAYMETWKAKNANATDAQIAKAELTYKASQTKYSDEEIAAHMAEFKEKKLTELGDALKKLIAKIEENHGVGVPIILARGMMEQDDELYLTAVTYMTNLIRNELNGNGHNIVVAQLPSNRGGSGEHPTHAGAAAQGEELAKFIKANFLTLVPLEDSLN